VNNEIAAPWRARSSRAQPLDRPTRMAAEYVLPLRWDDEMDPRELTEYLRCLSTWIDVTVVDGSAPAVFAALHRSWGDLITETGLRHLRPAGSGAGNGKVAGVVTGVWRARHERVVIADDDVRYERAQLQQLVDELECADLVRPQNVLVAERGRDRWHVRWDTARSLLNRAFGRDHPGTFALRRSTFCAMGGYRSDVLFENLELARTVAAARGREVQRRDLFIPRLAPTPGRFLEQRVRQAYDDFAQPVRLLAELSVLPLCLAVSRRGRPGLILLGALGCVAVAEYGRRRDGGAAVFPADAACWAPLWLGERAVCIWIAAGYRLTGGMPYRGRRIMTAAHSVRRLRRLGPPHPFPADADGPARSAEPRSGSAVP
jgi:hypothetical protein